MRGDRNPTQDPWKLPKMGQKRPPKKGSRGPPGRGVLRFSARAYRRPVHFSTFFAFFSKIGAI